jgi:hypothetical protein
MSLAAFAAPPLLLLVLSLAGRPLVTAIPGSAPMRWVYAVLAGLWLLHLLVTVLDLVGVPWGVATVLGPLLLVALWRLRERVPSAPSPGRGWGDGVAAAAVLAFAALAATSWIGFSDFVYHWGLKAHRFLVARQVDYEYLGQPWNWVLHPDYPNLLPELLAVTAMLGGGWREGALMLWSPLTLGLLLVVAREALAEPTPGRARLDAWSRQATLSVLACGVAAFGISALMAGSADWLVALALMAALPPLARPADRGGDLQLALCAAVAAASKAEGIPLAAWLLGVQLLRHLRGGWRTALASLPRLVLPVAAVVVPWAARVVQHSLYQTFNSGPFTPHKARAVLPALLESMASPAWHWLTLGLLLLPLLLLRRGPLWPFAAVLALQSLLYGWQYMSAPVDARFLVLSTFPRLALHLLPSVLVASALAWLREPPAAAPERAIEPAAAEA